MVSIKTLVAIGIGIGAALAVSAGVAFSATNDVPRPPPDPEWINPDGSVNPDKMPDELPMLDKDGNQRYDSNGDPVMSDVRILPPPHNPEAGTPAPNPPLPPNVDTR